jgi:pimeloyl-ACP methyl ester carboxylesterase
MNPFLQLGLVVAVFVFAAGNLAAEVTRVKIIPRDTDPAIGAEFNQPNTAYVDRGIVVEGDPRLPAVRRELLVFLPGTSGSGDRGGEGLCELAARLGYHAVSLTYPTAVAAAQVCANDPDPTAFESFRWALIEGGRSPHITVSRTESIEHRLIRLLQRLQALRPREAWGQFLQADGTLRWESIAVSGHSQGGGHAALIALRHRVARVICTGAPKDYSRALDAPAAWYTRESATPKSRFFTFNHVADRQGCNWPQQLRNLAALGLTALGAPVDVSKSSPPYGASRVLFTTFPATNDSREAHSSVIASKDASRLEPVWRYLLTAATPEGTERDSAPASKNRARSRSSRPEWN